MSAMRVHRVHTVARKLGKLEIWIDLLAMSSPTRPRAVASLNRIASNTWRVQNSHDFCRLAARERQAAEIVTLLKLVTDYLAEQPERNCRLERMTVLASSFSAAISCSESAL